MLMELRLSFPIVVTWPSQVGVGFRGGTAAAVRCLTHMMIDSWDVGGHLLLKLCRALPPLFL